MQIPANERLIVALDVPSYSEAEKLIKDISGPVKYFKVGSQLFTACGPKIVELIKTQGGKVFLDLKFHDIPNTVGKAAVSAVELGVDMFNLHSMGGFEMMEEAANAAIEACSLFKKPKPVILGVTVLTSFDEATFSDVLGAPGRGIPEQVLHLARLTKSAGLDGVVASPQEIELLRKNIGKDFVILTPGIRPLDAEAGDQKRILTPGQAIALGADYLVVGRPITGAKDRNATANNIQKEIQDALK
jgi:orotidine-5'-phosphate decarboxylase